MTGAIDLYGLSWDLPRSVAEELSGLHRPAVIQRGAAVGLKPGPVSRSGRRIWDSGDAEAIVVERDPGATTIAFDRDVFTISANGITYDGPDLAPALDRNLNPLAALLLPYHHMVALHGFVVDVGGRRVAISGESGAGKTTLGREVLGRGGVLVSDDLVALDGSGNTHPGPPFVRVCDPVDGCAVDAGGKFRLWFEPVPVHPRPLDLIVALDPDRSEPSLLEGLDALDLVLSRPYVPVASTAHELLLRLDIVEQATRRAIVLAVPPRWRPPSELADLVEAHLDS